MFDYDWFHGNAFAQQKFEAIQRCSLAHFPDRDPEALEDEEDFCKFRTELETRCLVHLRDGFSYEIKHFADVESKSHLTFECEPVDEQYRVGAFVVAVPFEDIVRVEVYAVHPSEKPEEMPQITGFKSADVPDAMAHPHPRKPDR